MRLLPLCALMISAFVAVNAQAFDLNTVKIEDSSLTEKYPAGSIQTREVAEAAVDDVKVAQQLAKDRLNYARYHCYENFLVNYCISQAEARYRAQDRRLRLIDTEARQWLRADDTRLEAERQRERDLKYARPEEVMDSEDAPTAKPSTQADEEALAKARAEEAARLKAIQEERKRAQARAAERQAEYERQRALEEQKLREYEQRLKEREERRAERERARAQRQSTEQ